MHLRSLYLQNFRNYKEAYLNFSPNFNLICGSNAKGKTSLLEAIHYFMLGRSFRTTQNTDLINHEEESFFLHTHFLKHDIDQQLRIAYEPPERQIIYNSTVLQSVSGLLGIIQGVIITPDDINLVKGSPVLRRQYLDIQIAQIDPLYVHHLARYTRAMRHRNHLLRIKQNATMDGWEQEMSHSAAYLIMQRQKAVQDLQKTSQQFYSSLSGEEETFTLTYKCGVSEALTIEELRQHHILYFRKNREREMRIGYTLGGPQKDDLLIAIEGRDVRHFASVGQQHSCVAAMHFAEWQRLKDISGQTPLLMVDDVAISLDDNRKKRLLKLLTHAGQVFLTTTDENLLDDLAVERKVVHVPLDG
jgi:DNA replication and repair protein RecF